MKKTTINLFNICLFIFLFSSQGFAENHPHNFVPKEGYVPDSKTALKVAEAILVPIYGNKVLDKKPFEVKLEEDSWVVSGSIPKNQLGGVPVVVIDKQSGAIKRVSHGK